MDLKLTLTRAMSPDSAEAK